MVGFKLPILLVLLHAVFGSAYRWFNWQYEVTCESDTYIAPFNEAEVSYFLKEQYYLGNHIKVVGNGHGFNNLSQCVDVTMTNKTSHIVSLTNLKSLSINKTAMTATFGAGWDVYDIINELKAEGLSFNYLGAERVQNFVGAASTGTHGTGAQIGNIASRITAMRILDSQGRLQVLSDATTPELMKAYRINLGALGLITEVTIKVEPTLILKKTTKLLNATTNYTEMYSQMAELYNTYERVTIWGPHFDWNATAMDYIIEPQYYYSYWEPTNYTGPMNCTVNYCSDGCGNCLYEYTCYGETSDAMSDPPQGTCSRSFYAEIEHFMPIKYLAEAATNYTLFQRSQIPRMTAPYNGIMIFQIREAQGDNSYMSPLNNYTLTPGESDVFGVIEIDWLQSSNNFTALWQNQELAYEFLPQFGETYNVTAHWNKMVTPNATYTAERYPMLPAWLKIQEQQDPKCQFVNEFLVQQLGITRCMNYLTM